MRMGVDEIDGRVRKSHIPIPLCAFMQNRKIMFHDRTSNFHHRHFSRAPAPTIFPFIEPAFSDFLFDRCTACKHTVREWCMRTHRAIQIGSSRRSLCPLRSSLVCGAYVRWAQHAFPIFLLHSKCTNTVCDAFECIFLMQNQSILIRRHDLYAFARSQTHGWFMHASAATEINLRAPAMRLHWTRRACVSAFQFIRGMRGACSLK